MSPKSKSLVTSMVTCPSNGKETGMSQEEFTTVLIEKLNQVKRDREVRESLEDALRQFQECEPWWMETKTLQPKTSYSINRNSISPDRNRKQQTANVKQKKKRKRRSVRNALAEYRNGYREPRNCSTITQRPTNCAQSRKCGRYDTVLPSHCNNDVTVVGYCIAGNPVPYTTKVRGKTITLGQFKSLLNRKGYYRYFFKKYSNEFGTNIVFEEVFDDRDALPLWEDKIFALVEEIEEFRL